MGKISVTVGGGNVHHIQHSNVVVLIIVLQYRIILQLVITTIMKTAPIDMSAVIVIKVGKFKIHI